MSISCKEKIRVEECLLKIIDNKKKKEMKEAIFTWATNNAPNEKKKLRKSNIENKTEIKYQGKKQFNTYSSKDTILNKTSLPNSTISSSPNSSPSKIFNSDSNKKIFDLSSHFDPLDTHSSPSSSDDKKKSIKFNNLDFNSPPKDDPKKFHLPTPYHSSTISHPSNNLHQNSNGNDQHNTISSSTSPQNTPTGFHFLFYFLF